MHWTRRGYHVNDLTPQELTTLAVEQAKREGWHYEQARPYAKDQLRFKINGEYRRYALVAVTKFVARVRELQETGYYDCNQALSIAQHEWLDA